MGAVENFRRALTDLQVDSAIVAQIMEGYEKISDRSPIPVSLSDCAE
jgi:hypothetical protein